VANPAPQGSEDGSTRRLTLSVDGQAVAFVEYQQFGKAAIVTHTEVDANRQGRGHGAAMARLALDHFRSQGWHVVPVCGFFAEQIRRHPEYADLLTPECRRIFRL